MLGHSHGEGPLNVLPELYEVWLDAWIDTMGELDPLWDGELDALWRAQLQPVIETMKSHYGTPVTVGA